MSKKVGLFLCPKGGGYANGIQNATLAKIDEAGEKLQNIGSSVENLELSRRGGKVNIGKYGSTEVDFVTQKEGVLTYYQVTADMTAEETFERDETAAEHSG